MDCIVFVLYCNQPLTKQDILYVVLYAISNKDPILRELCCEKDSVLSQT